MIIYNKYTGEIHSIISDDQNPSVFFKDFPDEFKNSIATLNVAFNQNSLQDYKIVDRKVVQRDLTEIQEIRMYGRVLTEEERLNILLRPSYEEISKAESTLEILSTLQEVGII